jgi:hypothetical protein
VTLADSVRAIRIPPLDRAVDCLFDHLSMTPVGFRSSTRYLVVVAPAILLTWLPFPSYMICTWPLFMSFSRFSKS